MTGIGTEGGACQLQCAILAVHPCPFNLGRREARPLAELSLPQATATPEEGPFCCPGRENKAIKNRTLQKDQKP